jgi:hypothetical protein
VFVGSTPQPFNKKVDICDDDVVDVLGASPRLSNLKARRVRFPNVIKEAVCSKLAKNEARSWLKIIPNLPKFCCRESDVTL